MLQTAIYRSHEQRRRTAHLWEQGPNIRNSGQTGSSIASNSNPYSRKQVNHARQATRQSFTTIVYCHHQHHKPWHPHTSSFHTADCRRHIHTHEQSQRQTWLCTCDTTITTSTRSPTQMDARLRCNEVMERGGREANMVKCCLVSCLVEIDGRKHRRNNQKFICIPANESIG
jgi:hypothetical protein